MGYPQEAYNSTLDRNNFVIVLNFTKFFFPMDHARKASVTPCPNLVTESQKYLKNSPEKIRALIGYKSCFY